MSDQNRDYEAIRDNIEKGVTRERQNYRRIFFGMHLIVYVVTMVVVWGTVVTNAQLYQILFNGQAGAGAGAIVIVPTILWAFVILCHLALLYTESDTAEKVMRERLLMRELGEEILRKGLADEGMAEKPKRRAAVSEVARAMLSDDGELIPADDDEDLEHNDYNARANRVGSS
jgi:hypothetical protein